MEASASNVDCAPVEDTAGTNETAAEPTSPTKLVTENEAEESDKCPICLEEFPSSTAVLRGCLHSFCLSCIHAWSLHGETPRCPLCKGAFSSAALINTASQALFATHTFVKPPPLHSPTSSNSHRRAPYHCNRPDRSSIRNTSRLQSQSQQSSHSREYSGTPNHTATQFTSDNDPATDSFLAAAALRSRVYEQGHYAKHVASNSHTRHAPFPHVLLAFRSSSAVTAPVRRKVMDWIRRDLRVLLLLENVELVLQVVVAVLDKHDIQTDAAVSLLRPFIHIRTEHFIHELVAFMRSGLTIDAYDAVVQYN
ncbi:hypothetical protein HDU81_007622 [Chytriomyces hyalinus]|nr:hypothetical protein HDU81_007622 [Chytriomyces hyalinus]